MDKADSHNKKLSSVFLLRKSRKGAPVPVVKIDSFPCRFQHEGREYVIEKTRKGGLIMKTE